MALNRLESSGKRLFEKIDQGKKYLEKEKETDEVNELLKLKNAVEKKRLQFEKDLEEYRQTDEKDDEKIEELRDYLVDGEELIDELEHYIGVGKEQAEERERQMRLQTQKEEKEKEKEKELREIEIKRIDFEENRLQKELEDKIRKNATKNFPLISLI